ncbi:sigma-70 family RNA polymerase sigma factor [Paenibacillus sp. BR2-3]
MSVNEITELPNYLTSYRVHNLKKFDNTGEDMEDLISIGTIGLIKAIESYRPNKGTKLATFAARCIENEILMHLRSLKKTRKDVSLHDPIGTDKEGNEITLIDILGSGADDLLITVDLNIEKSKIYRNLDILDDREKEVVVGRFGLDTGGEERTQREIAKELGISRSGKGLPIAFSVKNCWLSRLGAIGKLCLESVVFTRDFFATQERKPSSLMYFPMVRSLT